MESCFDIMNVLGSCPGKKEEGISLLFLFYGYPQYDGAMVAGVDAIMDWLDHLIAQGHKTCLGDHEIVQPLVLFRITPVLIGVTLHGFGRGMLGIQEIFRGADVSLGPLKSVKVSHNDRGQSAELCDFIQHYANAFDSGLVAYMVQMGVEYDEILTGSLFCEDHIAADPVAGSAPIFAHDLRCF